MTVSTFTAAKWFLDAEVAWRGSPLVGDPVVDVVGFGEVGDVVVDGGHVGLAILGVTAFAWRVIGGRVCWRDRVGRFGPASGWGVGRLACSVAGHLCWGPVWGQWVWPWLAATSRMRVAWKRKTSMMVASPKAMPVR